MNNIMAKTIATLVGIFIGTLAALLIDRRNEQHRLQRRPALPGARARRKL